jgi:hypothetical protein
MADNYNFTGLSSNVSLAINGPETLFGTPNTIPVIITGASNQFTYTAANELEYTKATINITPGLLNGIAVVGKIFRSEWADVDELYVGSISGMGPHNNTSGIWTLKDLVDDVGINSGPYTYTDDNTIELKLYDFVPGSGTLFQSSSWWADIIDVPAVPGVYEQQTFDWHNPIDIALDGNTYQFNTSTTLPPPPDNPLTRVYYSYDDGVDYKPNLVAKMNLILTDYTTTIDTPNSKFVITAKAYNPTRLELLSENAVIIEGALPVSRRRTLAFENQDLQENIPISDGDRLRFVRGGVGYDFIVTSTYQDDSKDGLTRYVYLTQGNTYTNFKDKVKSKLEESGFAVTVVNPLTFTVSALEDITQGVFIPSPIQKVNVTFETVTPPQGLFSFGEPDLELLKNLPVGSSLDAAGIEFIKVGDDQYVRSDGSTEPVTVLAGELKVYPSFTKICYKDGGIQRTPEAVEQPCMTIEGQVGPKIRTRYSLATTVNMFLSLSDPALLMLSSASRSTWSSQSSVAITAQLTNLGQNSTTGLFDYLIPYPIPGVTKGVFFMISDYPNTKIANKPLLCTGTSGGIRFSHLASVPSSTITVLMNIKVMAHVHNGKDVIPYTLTQVNTGIGYYIRLPGCLTKSFEITSNLTEMMSLNTTVDGVGGYESNPSLTDPTPHPYHSTLIDSGFNHSFTGSNSIIYLNGKVFPVSEFSFRTGDLVATDYVNAGSDDLTDTSGEYPGIVNLNSFSGVSGSTKGFLSQSMIQQIEKFNNNCTGSLILRGSSAATCLNDGSNIRDEFLIHIPNVTVVATVDNPASNTPTAVTMEYSAAYSPLYDYTYSLNYWKG